MFDFILHGDVLSKGIELAQTNAIWTLVIQVGIISLFNLFFTLSSELNCPGLNA